jgi:7-alpha-hydroxysteroid dehydrogenase
LGSLVTYAYFLSAAGRNAIAPGAIRTNALATVLTPEIEGTMLKHTPLGRLGELADIDNAALFPCAPAASWISVRCSLFQAAACRSSPEQRLSINCIGAGVVKALS